MIAPRAPSTRSRRSILSVLSLATLLDIPATPWAESVDQEQRLRLAKRIALNAPHPRPGATDRTAQSPDHESLSCPSPCTSGSLSQTGNGFFDVAVDCAIGTFTARTGTSHPSGAHKSILFGGDALAVGASGFALFVHDNATLITNPPAALTCAFNPTDTAAEPANFGLEQEWNLSPMAGVNVTLRQEVVAFGNSLTNAGIRLQLCVSSAPTSTLPVTLGLRWQLDYEHATDDGPLLSTVGCTPIFIGLELAQETELQPADLKSYFRIRSNNTLQTLETFTGSSWLSDWPDTAVPDRLLYGQWSTFNGASWQHGINGGQPTDLDAAVLYYLGYTPSTAITLTPGANACRTVIIRSEPRCNCGNGVVDPGEECDDGNEMSGDGCTFDCLAECSIAPGDTDAGAPKAGCPNAPIALTDALATPGTDLLWDDGGAGGLFLPDATSLSPTYSNAAPGSYTLRLTATDPLGDCQATDTVHVAILPLPVALFDHPTPVCFDCSGVQFTDLSTGRPVAWQWDLGDGSQSGQQDPLHVYDAPGTYAVSLVVTNACGTSAPALSSVDVVDLPTAAFDVVTPQCLGTAVAFTNQSSVGATSFVWDFGDGTTPVTDQHPVHTFAIAGVYTVSLRAANTCGDSAPVYRNVHVVTAPLASFTSNAPRCSGPVQFDDTSSGLPTQWTWTFGDGSPIGTLQNPSHTYAAPGTYSVTLTAINACGSSPPFMASITVSPTLGSSFQRWSLCTSARAPGTAPSPPYSPEDTTIGTTASTSWEFNDSTFCRTEPCTFAMYAVADCGTAMKFPLYDNETGHMRIFDILRDSGVTISANGGNAGCPWSQIDVPEVQWQDCTGTDCRWNSVVTTVSFTRQPAVCGVFRLEFVDWGGFWWDLFANCDGSNTPGFTIYDNICDAIAAYDPVPEFSIANLVVTGVCPDYTASFDVMNSGCVTADAPVRLTSTLGANISLVVSGLEPGVLRHTTVDVPVTNCVPGDFTVEVDPNDTVAECSETVGSAVSCNANPTADHTQTIPAPPPCLNPPIFCGATVAWDLDPCADTGVQIDWSEVIEPGSGGTASYSVYRDDVLIASGLTVTQYIDLGGTNGVEYRYRVQAVNACGLADLTFQEVRATDDVAPATPTDYGNTLYAVRWFQDVQLSWLPPVAIVSTQVRRDVVKNFSTAGTQAALTAPGSAWNDAGVVSPTAGTQLFYRVRGVNCAGQVGP